MERTLKSKKRKTVYAREQPEAKGRKIILALDILGAIRRRRRVFFSECVVKNRIASFGTRPRRKNGRNKAFPGGYPDVCSFSNRKVRESVFPFLFFLVLPSSSFSLCGIVLL